MAVFRRARYQIAGLGSSMLLFGAVTAALGWVASNPATKTAVAETLVQLPILFFLGVDVCILPHTRLGLPKFAVLGMSVAIPAWMVITVWAFATSGYAAGKWAQLAALGLAGLCVLAGFWVQAIKVNKMQRRLLTAQPETTHVAP